MTRSKLAILIAALLASGAAVVWCYGEEAKPKEKKRPATPAGATAKPNVTATSGPAKPPGTTPVAATTPPASSATGPAANKPVELGGPTDGKAINFSNGKPVVTDTPEDKVAINSALKDFSEASKGVTFGPTKKKKPEPAKN